MAKKEKALVVGESRWDGRLLTLIGTYIKMVLAMAVMAGIGFAIFTAVGEVVGIVALSVFAFLGLCWAEVIFIKWDTKNMVVSGQRMQFKANTLNLFFNIIKWMFLSVITLGIYALWLPIKVRKWQVKNTVCFPEEVEKEVDENEPVINYYEYDDEEELDD